MGSLAEACQYLLNQAAYLVGSAPLGEKIKALSTPLPERRMQESARHGQFHGLHPDEYHNLIPASDYFKDDTASGDCVPPPPPPSLSYLPEWCQKLLNKAAYVTGTASLGDKIRALGLE